MISFGWITPTSLTWLGFTAYAIAIAIHAICKGWEEMSRPDTKFSTFGGYLKQNRARLVPQWFLGVALFFLLWDNAAAGGLLSLPMFGDSPLVKIGVAMVFGWFSDSLLNRVLTLYRLTPSAPPEP